MHANGRAVSTGSCGFKRQHFFLISQDASQMEVNDGVAVNV